MRGALSIALVLTACGGDDGMQRGGDGATWRGAWTELPDQLERGHVHYVAAGDYPGHRFDDAASGDLDQWQSRAGDVVASNPGFTGIPGIDGAPVADPTATMFSLGATSKAADKGVAAVDGLTLPSTDFFGAARDAEPDIGAVER